MEGNTAATYILIYRFLKQQSQHKAAEAVKKAAKAIVILRDDIKQEGPPLEDIIKEWKTMENTRSDSESSSKDSDSSDDSPSDSEDSSSSDSSSKGSSGSESKSDDASDSDDNKDDSDKATTAKKPPPQKPAERDTSATLSSESAQKVAKHGVQIPKKRSTKDADKATKDRNKSSESDTSGSDSSDSDGSSSSSASDSSGAESPSSSSDASDENEANEKASPNRTKFAGDKSRSTSESSSESDDDSDSEPQQKEDMRIAKKRKTSDNGAAVTTAVATGSRHIPKAPQKNEKPTPEVRERFQRVKFQNLVPDQLLNNDYEARGGARNDYGERAHRDLIATRGAGFRKEKNKKKRGSYRGGEITMENHSIKFDF